MPPDPATHKQSVDEVMVAYKGKQVGNLQQYIKTNPDKWGFKLFCRAAGIIHDYFNVYQGQTTFLPLEQEKLGLGGKVVTELCKTIALPKLSVVFCSFPLFHHPNSTMGLKAVGTVKSNRTGGAPLLTGKALMARGRGAFDCTSTDNIIAVKW